MKIEKLDLAKLIEDRNYDGIVALIISKIPLLITAAIIIVIGIFVAKLIGNLIVKGLRLKGIDPSIHNFIRAIVKTIINTIFILSALSTLGLNINSFVAALAAGGVTAGLGLQHSISQFASGIQILMNHPFKSGDFIDIGTVSGTVKEIRFMQTVLITLDNKRVIVPNSHITDSNIINYNAEKERRVDLKYSISYNSDIEKAKKAILKAASACKLIFKEPKSDVAVCEHGQSSVNLVCHVWCNSKDYWEVFYFMQERVKFELDKAGIQIPFNQLDLHITEETLEEITDDKSVDKIIHKEQ